MNAPFAFESMNLLPGGAQRTTNIQASKHFQFFFFFFGTLE